MNKLFRALGKIVFRKKEVICLPDTDEPYLVRYRVRLPRFIEKLVVINLHQILRSDEGRDLHDHPFNFWGIILRGKYREYLQNFSLRPPFFAIQVPFSPYGDVYHEDRGPLSIRYRRAHTPHRLELIKGPVWTIIVRGPKFRKWGFITSSGWIPHALAESKGKTNEFAIGAENEDEVSEGGGGLHAKGEATSSRPSNLRARPSLPAESKADI